MMFLAKRECAPRGFDRSNRFDRSIDRMWKYGHRRGLSLRSIASICAIVENWIFRIFGNRSNRQRAFKASSHRSDIYLRVSRLPGDLTHSGALKSHSTFACAFAIANYKSSRSSWIVQQFRRVTQRVLIVARARACARGHFHSLRARHARQCVPQKTLLYLFN